MPTSIQLNRNTLNAAGRFFREDVGAWFGRPNKKPLFRQAAEFVDLWRAYRAFPYQYLKFDLYTRDVGDGYRAYIPNRIADEYVLDINHEEQKFWLEDKLEFDRRARAAGIPLLDIWAVLASAEDGVALRDLDGQSLSLNALWERAKQKGSRAIFVKPCRGTQGLAAFRLDVGACGFERKGEAVDEAKLRSLVDDGGYLEFLVQDYFEQHPATAAINAESVNTLRILTLLTDGKVETTGAFFRTGPAGRETDNWMTGGYAAGVDLATGQVAAGAKLKHKNGRSTIEMRHAATGVEFASIKIPFVDQAVEIVTKGALDFAPIRLIGWDVVMGKDGPFILEGNWLPGLLSVQQACGGLRSTALARELAAKLHWR